MSRPDLRALPPAAVVLDLVLKWAPLLGTEGTAVVSPDGSHLTITTRNHRGEYVMTGCPIHLDGEPSHDPPRWVLRQLGPGVWKLAPSMLDVVLHAYVTIVDVPEPPPWSGR